MDYTEEQAKDRDDVAASATCLWCGAPRPVDVDVCPTCNHAWIDATLDEANAGRLDDLTVAPEGTPPPSPWWRRRWMPLAIAGFALAVYAAIFWMAWDRTDGEPSGTTAAVGQTSLPAATSAPDTTATATTTTLPPTTTTTAATTTTTTTTTLPPIPAVEPPYDPDELTLGAFALGPIRFGSEGDSVGRLVATFGQPSSQFPVGENWGMCPTETARALEFGHLNIILRQVAEGETVAGYRLLTTDGAAADDPTAGLRSISGLGLGDTLSRAKTLYAVVTTATLEDGTAVFIVSRSSDRRTLLWGELSNDADPLVLSINSPRPCDGGPFPS